jgi:hypothetical protein
VQLGEREIKQLEEIRNDLGYRGADLSLVLGLGFATAALLMGVYGLLPHDEIMPFVFGMLTGLGTAFVGYVRSQQKKRILKKLVSGVLEEYAMPRNSSGQ